MNQKINQKNEAMNAKSNDSLKSKTGYKNIGNSGINPGQGGKTNKFF